MSFMHIYSHQYPYLFGPPTHTQRKSKLLLTIILFQSITVPLQGFLNSIVYGRTRDDFIDVMDSTGRFKETGENNEKLLVTLKGGLETNSEDGQSELYSRSLSSASQEDEGISEDSDGQLSHLADIILLHSTHYFLVCHLHCVFYCS